MHVQVAQWRMGTEDTRFVGAMSWLNLNKWSLSPSRVSESGGEEPAACLKPVVTLFFFFFEKWKGERVKQASEVRNC